MVAEVYEVKLGLKYYSAKIIEIGEFPSALIIVIVMASCVVRFLSLIIEVAVARAEETFYANEDNNHSVATVHFVTGKWMKSQIQVLILWPQISVSLIWK